MRVRGLLMLAGAGALAGCSAGAAGGHSDCKDATTTQAYSLTWQDDLAKARHADKLSVDEVVKLHGDMFEKLGLLKEERFADFCRHLDEARADAGF